MTMFSRSLPALFDGGLGAHGEAAAAGLVGGFDAFAAGDVAAGRKIRAGHDLHDFFQRGVRLFDQQNGGFDDFAQVVRRDVGGHADGDAARAVDQQIRNARGQDDGFFARLVEVGNEIDGFFFEVGENFLGDFRQARFGVPHGRRRIAVDRAEVSLPVDQRVAHVEILRQAHQRGVDHGFAVRMISCRRCRRRSWRTCGSRDWRPGPDRSWPTRMRRCTGFRPSRTSGSARAMITLIA